MRRGHFEMDVEGDQKAISKVMQTYKGMNDLRSVVLRQRRIELHMQEEAIAAPVLAHVFNTLAENKPIGTAQHIQSVRRRT